MAQSKKSSLLESIFNTLVGYSIAVFSQRIIFPAYGVVLPLTDNLQIALWFTLISLGRNYAIRRWFNRNQHAKYLQPEK